MQAIVNFGVLWFVSWATHPLLHVGWPATANVALSTQQVSVGLCPSS